MSCVFSSVPLLSWGHRSYHEQSIKFPTFPKCDLIDTIHYMMLSYLDCEIEMNRMRMWLSFYWSMDTYTRVQAII